MRSRSVTIVRHHQPLFITITPRALHSMVSVRAGSG
jgi:hypothetical protein